MFTSPTSTPTTTPVPAHKSSVIGAAVGGTVAGIFLITLTIFGIFFCRRRRLRRQKEENIRQQLEQKPVPFNPVHSPSVDALLGTATRMSQLDLTPRRSMHKSYPEQQTFVDVSVPSVPSSYYPNTDHGGAEADIAAVPALLARLNNIISRLPQETEGKPPNYVDRT